MMMQYDVMSNVRRIDEITYFYFIDEVLVPFWGACHELLNGELPWKTVH